MITVLPEGGLCNRMRVVASAWLVAQARAQPLRVLWYRTTDFNARFDAIFEKAGLPFQVEERSAPNRVSKLKFRLHEAAARMRRAQVWDAARTEPGQFDFEREVALAPTQSVFIRTNSRLKFDARMYEVFKPSPAIDMALSPMHKRLSESVGVHIRGTDNRQAAAVSTLGRFMQLMDDALSQEPGSQFFVATDEPHAMEALQARYGQRIWIHPKRSLDRNDPAAIEDAMIDLYGLSRTRRLIGSYWSSFTDTAAEIRGIPCVIAKAGDAS